MNKKNKGLILRIQGNFSQSLEILKNCHLINEKNPEFLKQISRTLYILGKYKSSIEVASEALKLDPKDWVFFY